MTFGYTRVNSPKKFNFSEKLNFGDIAGIDPSTLELRYWDGSDWAADGITLIGHDEVNRVFTAAITHLSQFALLGTGGSEIYLPVVLRP